MRLSHNLASLNIYRTINRIEGKQSKAMARVSSGQKVTCAADEPNKIAESERIKLELRAMQSTSRNIQDGISMLQTAEGGLNEMSGNLIRLRELIVQSGNDSLTSYDKKIIQNEIEGISEDIHYLSKNTQFNSKSILCNETVKDNDNPEYIKTVIGSNVGETIEIPTFNFSKESLDLDKIDITKGGKSVDEALGILDKALGCVNRARSKFGGVENRLEDTYNNTEQVNNVFQKAESSISDTEIDEEVVELAKNNILLEAGNAIMVQTNKLPMDVLRILENMK